jgi:hypothetical protein
MLPRGPWRPVRARDVAERRKISASINECLDQIKPRQALVSRDGGGGLRSGRIGR